MAGKKVGSDGQVRKTTAEWTADTATYPEGMRLMNTDTGTVRVSKGTTYALAWTPSTGGGSSAWGEITGTLSDQTDLQSALDDKLDTADLAPTATFSTNTKTDQDPGQDTVRFNSGTIGSVTEIALSDVVGGVDKGTLNSLCSGIIQFRLVGTTETIEFQITSAVHTSWTRYTVTYLKGTIPANGTVMAVRFLPSNTVNAATTAALDGKADEIPTYIATLTQSGTSAPVANVIKNTLGGSVSFGYVSAGNYSVTATGLLTVGKTAILVGSGAMDIISLGLDGFVLFTYDLSAPQQSDDILLGQTIKIEVHP